MAKRTKSKSLSPDQAMVWDRLKYIPDDVFEITMPVDDVAGFLKTITMPDSDLFVICLEDFDETMVNVKLGRKR